MKFTLIKGTFQVKGYSPDGDSVRFQADNPASWQRLSGRPVELNARQHAQLRIEAIDTLETHYSPDHHAAPFHQPVKFAHKALLFLLNELAIKQVKFSPSGALVSRAKDGTRGYILASKTEGNGRPVSFVFAGDPPEADGTKVTLDAARLEQSVNFKTARAGLAYPTFYTGMNAMVRGRITAAVNAARAEKLGLWPKDKTMTGFKVASTTSVTKTNIILPKLFRRIIAYMGHGGAIDGFKGYLASHGDPVLVLPGKASASLADFIEVKDKQVRLTIAPELLLFKEKA